MKTLTKISDFILACAGLMFAWLLVMAIAGMVWTGGIIAFQLGGGFFRYLFGLLFDH